MYKLNRSYNANMRFLALCMAIVLVFSLVVIPGRVSALDDADVCYISEVGPETGFESLDGPNGAIKYIESHSINPATVVLVSSTAIGAHADIPAGFNVQIMSENGKMHTISRKTDYNSSSLFFNYGNLTLSNLILENGDAVCKAFNGGAVYSDGPSLTINSCTFKAFNIEYASGKGGKGGAVFINSGNLTVSDSHFIDCYSKGVVEGSLKGGEGGAICSYGGSVSITGTEFYGHKDLATNIENANRGGALSFSGSQAGSIAISNCQFYNCSVCVLGYENNPGSDSYGRTGGVLYCNRAASGSDPTVFISNCEIDGSKDAWASDGAIHLIARDGGGIYMNAGTLKMENTTIHNCYVYNKGGALYTKRDAELIGCTVTTCGCVGDQPRGAGLNIVKEANQDTPVLTLDNSTVSNCYISSTVLMNNKHCKGAGVCAEGDVVFKNTVTIINNRIDNYEASNGAGLYVFQDYSLTIGDGSNNPVKLVIHSNTAKDGANSNVVLMKKSTGLVLLNNLTSDTEMFISGAVQGAQFGVVQGDKVDAEHSYVWLIKSEDGSLSGTIEHERILWDEYFVIQPITGSGICVITDSLGNLLNVSGNEARYDNLTEAFNNYQNAQFTYNGHGVQPAMIQMIVSEYEMNDSVAFSAIEKSMIFTSNTDSCVITRGESMDTSYSMFDISGSANIIVNNLTFDANGEHSPFVGSGSVFKIIGASVTMAENTVIRNSKATAEYAGAVYVDSNGSFTMTNNATIESCYTVGRGGGVCVMVATFNMYDDATIRGCNATMEAGGVGVYGDYNSRKQGYMNMHGGNIIQNLVGNGSTDTKMAIGAGIMVGTYGRLSMSGLVNFGGPDNAPTSTNGNYRDVTKTVTNGGETCRWREDIGTKSADAITVTGNLSGGVGSIWVWSAVNRAEKSIFAKKNANTEYSVAVFRNANPNNTNLRLLGATTDSAKTITWGETDYVEMHFRKIDSAGNPLSGAEFVVSGPGVNNDHLISRVDGYLTYASDFYANTIKVPKETSYYELTETKSPSVEYPTVSAILTVTPDSDMTSDNPDVRVTKPDNSGYYNIEIVNHGMGIRKVILKSVMLNYTPRTSGVFTITLSGSNQPIPNGSALSPNNGSANGVFFIGELAYGTYEIKDSTNGTVYYLLYVTNDGVKIVRKTE